VRHRDFLSVGVCRRDMLELKSFLERHEE